MRPTPLHTSVLRLASVVGATSLMLLAGACSSAVPHRRASLGPAGTSADSWHVVLPSPATDEYAEIRPGAEAYARRDTALALRPDPIVDGVAASWPSPERPSLSETRRLYLNNRPGTVVYFRGTHERRTYRTYAY